MTFHVTDLDSNALRVTRDGSGHLVQASGYRVVVRDDHTSRDDYTGPVMVDRVAPMASAATVMAWETATLTFSEPLLTEDVARASGLGLVREDPLPLTTYLDYVDALRVHLTDWRQRTIQGIVLDARDPAGNVLAPFDFRSAFHDAGESQPLFDFSRDEPTVNDPSVRRSSEGQSRFTTWAATIAVNCAVSELRRRRYRHVSIEEAGEMVDWSPFPGDRDGALEEEQIALLRRGIAEALTDKQRQAIQAALGGLPLTELARRWDVSQRAVYKLLHDARLRLESYMAGRAS